MRIAITGPAAAGKGTIARAFARQYRMPYVDVGLIFRFAAYSQVVRLCSGITDLLAERYINRWQYVWDGRVADVSLDGVLLGDILRTADMAERASILAAQSEVSRAMIAVAEAVLSQYPFVIADGRSVGTAILPDADVIFYIDADCTVRAARRHADLLAIGATSTHEQVATDLAARDQRDRERQYDQFSQPIGAVRIDTTNLDIQAAVDLMSSIVLERRIV